MIEAEDNEYFEIPYVHPIFFCGLPIAEATEKELASLDEDSTLGPDFLFFVFFLRAEQIHILAATSTYE